MKLPKIKFNQKGIAHIIAPLAFVAVFAAVGSFVLLKSHAQTTTYLWGHTYVNGVSRSGTRVAIKNTNTGATGATLSSGTLGRYTFNSIVVGYTYSLHATITIGCTRYSSGYPTVTAQYNNGNGNYKDLYLTNTQKVC
jgi:hypothetical protein